MLEWLAFSLGLSALAAGAVLCLRAREAARLATERLVYRLDFPQALDPQAVVRCLVGLSGSLGSPHRRWLGMEVLVFEVTADPQGIRHQLRVPASLAEAVTGQLRAALPDVRLTAITESADSPGWTLARELRLAAGALLRTDQPESASAAWLGALQPLRDGEAVCWHWLIRPDGPRQRLSRYRPARWSDLLGRTDPEATAEARRERALKLAEPLFLAVGRVGVRAATPERARQLLRRLLGAAWVLNAPGGTLRVRRLTAAVAKHRLEQARVPLLVWPLLLNAAELAGVLGFPVGAIRLPGLTLGGCRQLAPSPLIPRTGRLLARSTYPGEDRPLAIAPTDRLRHLWALGPTGSGKSTLLLNLITQDMQAGAGVVVSDPVGDLVDNCLDRVPAGRVADVIVLDPMDDALPVGLNALAGGDPELVTDQVVGIFHNLYAAFWGPRSDDILRGAVGTLVRQPQPYTLCEVPRLLTDAAWRRQLVGHLDDPIGLEAFWASYEAWKEGERTAAIAPILNKLRALTLRSRVRRIIGQAEGIDLGRVLAEGKLLFVPLRKGLLGEETASLLGALLLSRLWQAVQGRVSLPSSQRRPVMAVLDEFQDYLALPTNLATVLAQSRALGLGLTLAHQHLGQLPREVRAAVLANARTKIVFQSSADDARTLAREFAPHLGAEDLQGLGPYEVAALIAVAGQVAPPATGVTYPPSEATGQAAAARAYSQARYGVDATEVEAAIRARHGAGNSSGPIGRVRRSS